MKPSGVIYRANGAASGEVKISLTQKEKKRMQTLQWMGANFASFTIAAVLFFYGPGVLMDFDYITSYARVQGNVQAQDAKPVAEPVEPAYSLPSPIPTPTATSKPKVKEFTISIPAIEASSSVLEDIDPFDKEAYLGALEKGIAHAKGTGKPGESRRIYLFAHSTNSPLYFSQYNAVFYQLRLLEEGDEVVANYNGDTYIYKVIKKVVVDANDLTWLNTDSDGEQLVLQTCDPPGTTLHRLLVIAEPAL